MPLVSSAIPNLIGGVSQQPPAIRMVSQCAVMENCLPSIVEQLRRRPATRHVARLLYGQVDKAAIHVINRDSTEQYVVVAIDNTLKVFDLEGEEYPITFDSGENYLKVDSPDTSIAFLTINDYTFILNKTITVKATDETTAVRRPEALVFIKQASYATDYHVTLDGTTYTHTTYKDDNRRASDGLEFTTKNGFNMDNTAALDAARYKLSSHTIAADLAGKINASGVYSCQMFKSTLWVRRNDNKAFKATVSDSRSNTQVSVTTDRVQRFSDLPITAPDGYVTEITGDQSSSFDNYYVKFEANDGNAYDDGVWVETVKPGITYALDVSTLPHALVREADGTFHFKTLEWKGRRCGDLDSAPDPSFLGRELSALMFYRNRLGFLARENCVLSEAGEFFNFYPTTVTTMVDSDPIDVAASHVEPATLRQACSSPEGLVLFSEKTQFLLEHDDVFSGKTTNIKPTTAYECSVEATPVGAGNRIFFATNRGNFAGVREYYIEEDFGTEEAADLTSHVPHYIHGTIHRLIGSTNEDCLLALTTKERNAVALYKYFWNGREKLQSAWSKWTFTGEVLSAAFLNSTILFIIQYPDGVYLERLNIEPGYTDDGAPFEYIIDRKITESDTAIEYDASQKTTTVTLPYQITGSPILVSRHTMSGEVAESTVPPGVVHENVSWEENRLTVDGDLRGVLFYTGISTPSRFRFSPLILREDSSGGKLAVTEGRLQVRNFTLTYGDTGYFEVHVTPEARETDRRIFNGCITSHGSNIIAESSIPSGTYRFPVLSRADTTVIEIFSNSHLPFQITSAGWEGYYHSRSSRV